MAKTMLMKVFADRTQEQFSHKLSLKNWFWIIVGVIPMGIAFTIITLIAVKMDEKEGKY